MDCGRAASELPMLDTAESAACASRVEAVARVMNCNPLPSHSMADCGSPGPARPTGIAAAWPAEITLSIAWRSLGCSGSPRTPNEADRSAGPTNTPSSLGVRTISSTLRRASSCSICTQMTKCSCACRT